MGTEYLKGLSSRFVKDGRLHHSRHTSLVKDLGLRMNGLALSWADISGRHTRKHPLII